MELLVKLLLIEKFFQATPFDKISILLAIKEGNAFEKVAKIAGISFLDKIVTIIHKKCSDAINNSIKKDIDLKVADLAFHDKNTEIIIKLQDINKISQQMSSIHNSAANDLSSIIRDLLMPHISARNEVDGSSTVVSKTFNTYPSLFLLEGLIQTIFAQSNINILSSYIENKVFGSSNSYVYEYSETTTQTIGAFTIRCSNTINQYAYNNIQEIAKLGGNQWVLGTLRKYIKNSNITDNFAEQTVTVVILNLLKDIVHNLSYVSQFSALGITTEQINTIEYNLSTASTMQGVNENKIDYEEEKKVIDQLQNTLKALRNEEKGQKRLLSNDITLSVQNYHLQDLTKEKEMLCIGDLKFIAGSVYAITGTIGTGKTTFLNDIAQCLSPNFSSKGDIFYPSHNEQAVPKIFCGTVPFTPPATTLLEKLTYRLPENYRSTNEENIIKRTLELFHNFNQTNFTCDSLLTKNNKEPLQLSTGQGKIAMIISAILYKEYLKQLVLFVIDETLANLDTDTTNLVCEFIKKLFQDSIVISVDHQAKGNLGFYDNFIDLTQYKVDVIGNNSLELVENLEISC